VAFYDIDTPISLASLAEGTCPYLSRELVPQYSLYLSITGGPTLEMLRRQYSAQWVRPLYCSADPDVHYPEPVPTTWDLGYVGSQLIDGHAGVERLLVESARAWEEGRYVVAGSKNGDGIAWPSNVERLNHLTPTEQRRVYNRQRFTLNVPRRTRLTEGRAPNIGIFEAAACGTPIVSEPWPGLEELLVPGVEVLVVRTAADVTRIIRELPEEHRLRVANAARARILAEHTSQHRAETFERYTRELLDRYRRPSTVVKAGPVREDRWDVAAKDVPSHRDTDLGSRMAR
jgi:spore maturation protein CgeB